MQLRTFVLATAIAAAAGSTYLLGQQQAAEAPASTRPGLTRPAVAGRHGLVTTGHPIASAAGLQILIKGGNAFDAVAAVGAMAGLGEPEMNGIGGNGFMTVFHKATNTVYFGQGSNTDDIRKCTNGTCAVNGAVLFYDGPPNISVQGLAFGTTKSVTPSGFLSFIAHDSSPTSHSVRACLPASTSCLAASAYLGEATSIAAADGAIYFTKGPDASEKQGVWAVGCLDTNVCGTPVLIWDEPTVQVTSIAAQNNGVFWTTTDGRIMRGARPGGL